MILFEKVYDGESLYDLSRDLHEAFKEPFNPNAKELTKDQHGFLEGEFKVTIEWIKP